MCDLIGVDLFTTCHEEYGIHVFRHRKAYLEKRFAVPSLQKIEISHTLHRNSKHNAGEEGRPGPPKSYDIRGKKLLSSQFASMELIWDVTK